MHRRSFLKQGAVVAGATIMADPFIEKALAEAAKVPVLEGTFPIPIKSESVTEIILASGSIRLTKEGKGSIDLNDTAAFLWMNIDGKRSAFDLGKLLEKEHDISENLARCDTLNLISMLENEQYVISAGQAVVYSKSVAK